MTCLKASGARVVLLLLLAVTARADTFVFGGADLGVSGLKNNSSLESNKFGVDLGLKGLVSAEFDGFLIDVGGGWRWDRVSGGPDFNRMIIDTRNAFVEFSPRFIIRGSPWQVGPWGQFHFGSQVGMTEVLAQSQRTAISAGAQLNNEWGNETNRCRFGVRGGVDLDLANRVHWTAGILFQVGLRILSGGNSADGAAPPVEQTDP